MTSPGYSPKYSLLKNDFDDNLRFNKKDIDYFDIIITIVNILLFYFAVFIFSKYLVYDLTMGIGIVNFYRGIVYIVISSFYLYYNNIDLEKIENFDKNNFYFIVTESLFEAIKYLLLLFSLKYLSIYTFTFYICTIVFIKMILSKVYIDQGIGLEKHDSYLLALSIILLVLEYLANNFIGKSNGILFFLLFTICAYYRQEINGKNKSPNITNFYLKLMMNGICTVMFTPLIICWEKSENLININRTLLSIVFSIFCFFSEVIYHKYLRERLEKEKNKKITEFKYFLVNLMIIINIIFTLSSIYNILICCGFILVFFYKFQYL